MDPLSRKLNGKYQKVSVNSESGMFTTNHLLFIDDLKLLSESEEELRRIMNEMNEFFDAIGLQMNKNKSATNSISCKEEVTLLEGRDSYKYLGIIETANSIISKESLRK